MKSKAAGGGKSLTMLKIWVGGLLALTLISGYFLVGAGVRAVGDNSATDNVSVTIESSCTMKGRIDSAHTATVMGGTFNEGIGQTTLTAFCNDRDGFIIYAVGMSDDTEGNTYLRNVNRQNAATDIQTGVYTTGATTSSWAMKLAAVDSVDSSTGYAVNIASGFTSDHAVPSSWTEVAYRQSATGGQSSDLSQGASLTTTYSTYVKESQAAGTYVGKVAYAMFHPYATATPISLKKAFQNAGKSMEQITVYPNDPTKTEVKGYYKMQDITPEICAAANLYGEASQVELIDMRDHKVYWAAKLADGKCWMTQSLDLDLAANAGASYSYVDANGATQTGNTVLTSENTNLKVSSGNGYSTGYSVNNDVITWTPSMSTTKVTSTADLADWDENQQTLPKSWDMGLWYENGEYHNSSTCDYLTSGEACTYFSQTPYATNGTHGAVGNYYNWTQAIASNNSSAITNDSFNDPLNLSPKNSVCPKGWRLPMISNQSAATAGSTNEFARLNFIYNENLTDSGAQGRDRGLFLAPLYFVRAGYVASDALNYSGVYGYYWSSTVLSGTYARYLGFSSTSVYPQSYSHRYYGWALRCVAE